MLKLLTRSRAVAWLGEDPVQWWTRARTDSLVAAAFPDPLGTCVGLGSVVGKQFQPHAHENPMVPSTSPELTSFCIPLVFWHTLV